LKKFGLGFSSIKMKRLKEYHEFNYVVSTIN